MDEATVQHWMREHPTFLSSVKSGRAEADANVAASLYHRANGYSHKAEKIAFNKDGEALRAEYTEHYPPDAASAIFWLKNRRRDLWRDNPHRRSTCPLTMINRRAPSNTKLSARIV